MGDNVFEAWYGDRVVGIQCPTAWGKRRTTTTTAPAAVISSGASRRGNPRSRRHFHLISFALSHQEVGLSLFAWSSFLP